MDTKTAVIQFIYVLAVFLLANLHLASSLTLNILYVLLCLTTSNKYKGNIYEFIILTKIGLLPYFVRLFHIIILRSRNSFLNF